MAVSKKQPAKKRQKKKSSLWIISLIAVILLILVGVVFLVLPKFRKEAAPEKPETIKVEAAEKSYAAGSRISENTEYPGKRNSFWMQIHTACHWLKCRHMATVLP